MRWCANMTMCECMVVVSPLSCVPALLCIVVGELKFFSWSVEPVITVSVTVEEGGCTIRLLGCKVGHTANGWRGRRREGARSWIQGNAFSRMQPKGGDQGRAPWRAQCNAVLAQHASRCRTPLPTTPSRSFQ